MNRFFLHTSETAQWHALVTEAEASANYCLDERLESYLVFLLMRYVDRTDIVDQVLAMDYPTAVAQSSARTDQLRDVGDQCLIFAGLFPEQAQHRVLPVSYFVNMGRNAYQSVGEAGDQLFSELSAGFVGMMDVLQTMRDLDDGDRCLDPLSAHLLWHDTGSRNAWNTLREATQAIPSGFGSKLMH